MGSRPTIYDVARAAGVSKSLVSLVLNGSDLVSEPRRRAVLAAMESLGYRPSRAATTLAAARSHVVGVLIDDYRNPWFVELLHGLREALVPHGYHLTVADLLTSGGSPMDALEGFLGEHVDALVVAAELGRDHDDLGVPTVVVGNREHAVSNADRVTSDERAGVRLLLQHLVAHGHRRIGHVTGVGGSARWRLDAYCEVLGELGEDVRWAGSTYDTNEEGGYRGTVELLARHPEVTAVFAANDTMALGARAALREASREVPADVALVGYDDSLLAKARYLDLTTVDSRNADVGRAAGGALLRRLSEPAAAATNVVIEPRLVVRSSSVHPPPERAAVSSRRP